MTKWASTLQEPEIANKDFLIVGAGFAGAVCAERLASSGKRVLILDRRPHIGGNAFDTYDAKGILVHPYGPHIFHTNSKRVFAYLSRFTDWRFYEHRVLAEVGDKLYPLPINRLTLNASTISISTRPVRRRISKGFASQKARSRPARTSS